MTDTMKSTKISDFRRNVPGRLRLRAAALSLLAAGLLATGCSKEQELDPEEGNGSGKVAVSFEVEGLSEMTTKAALTANTTVRVVAYKSNSANPATNNYVADQAYYWNGSKLVPCTVDANGTKTADAAGAAMKLLPGNYDFYAVSPAIPLNTNHTTLATAVANYVDYATSKKTQQIPVQTTPYALTLSQLQRQCAQVSFIVKKDASYVAPTTMSINSVKVTGLAASQSGVTVGKDLTAASSGTQVLTLASGDFSNSGTTYTTKNSYLLLPLSGAKLTFSFDLTLDGTNKTIAGELTGLTLEKSKTYTITAQIFESDITLSIDAWTQNTGNNPDFDGPGYPYTIEAERTIVYQDRFGSFDASYTLHALHGPWTKTPAHSEAETDSNNSGVNTFGTRFKVASSRALAPDSSYEMNWYEAVGDYDKDYNPDDYEACAEYSEDAGQSDKGLWRLPTIRELSEICSTYHTKVWNTPLGNYWATTDSSDDNTKAWTYCASSSLLFSGSFVHDKTDTDYVYCVRDL